MTGSDLGGHLPLFGRMGEFTPGMSALLYILLGVAVIAVALIVRVRMNDGRHMELTIKACVTEKREDKSGVNCLVTFQFAEVETRTLRLTAAEAGTLAEGDQGRLTFRGKRYVFFERS